MKIKIQNEIIDVEDNLILETLQIQINADIKTASKSHYNGISPPDAEHLMDWFDQSAEELRALVTVADDLKTAALAGIRRLTAMRKELDI